MRARRHVIAVLAILLAVAACTPRRGARPRSAAAGAALRRPPRRVRAAGARGTGSRLDQGSFGELEQVCSEGEPGTTTEVGLTADEIRLGTVTDKGSAERPGLTQEMYDTAVAFAAWCNEHGGIGGRTVVIDDLDAKLFEYGQRVDEACQQDFALVGGRRRVRRPGQRRSGGMRPDQPARLHGHPAGAGGRAAGPAGAEPGVLVRGRTATAGCSTPTPTSTSSASCGSTSTGPRRSTPRRSRWPSSSGWRSCSTSSTGPSARRAGAATSRRCATRASRRSR